MSKSRPGTANSRRAVSISPGIDPGVQLILNKIKSAIKSRGSSGFIGMQRRFKIMDDDGSKSLNLSEFKKGMKEMKIDLPDNDLRKVFEHFDQDNSGSISFEELLQGIRDPMNDRRLALVKIAFSIIDIDGSGAVDLQEIASKYDASKHPEVMSRRRTTDDVLREFMETFEVGGSKDGIVTMNEFINYYSNISASIDNEDYFELMIRNAWHISGGEGQAANTANKRVLVTGSDGTQVVVEIKNDLGLKQGDREGMMQRLKAQGVDASTIDTTGAAGDEIGVSNTMKRRRSKKMNGRRRKLVRTVFKLVDADGNGEIDAFEVANKYDASQHPEVMAGIRTKEQVLREFLDTFDVGGVKDGIVTEEEFLNYYESVSCLIKDDEYFELMIRNAWHLSGGKGQAANTANRRVLVTARDGTQSVREIQNDLGILRDDRAEMILRLQKQGDDAADIGLSSGPGKGHGRTMGSRSARPPVVSKTKEKPYRNPKVSLQQKLVVETLLEVMRAQLLVRGPGGVVDLQRRFMDMDIDNSSALDREEFKNGMDANGFTFSKHHIDALFTYFDCDDSGEIDYEEFLEGLRGSFPVELEDTLNRVFDRLIPDAKDCVDPQTILDQYNPKGHPDVKNKSRRAEDVYQEFVDTFDMGAVVIGMVTREEFLKYFRNMAIVLNNDYGKLDRLVKGVWSVNDLKNSRQSMKSPGRRYMAATTGTGTAIGSSRLMGTKQSMLASRLRSTMAMNPSEPEFEEDEFY